MAKQPTNGDTYETMMERSHEALKKEREDILAKQKEIAEQLEAVDRKLYAYELFDKAIKGEITPDLFNKPTAPTAPPKERTPRAPSTGSRAPRGELTGNLLDLIKKNPEKKSYYCFASKRGGDVIALVAHIRGLQMKQAAEAIVAFAGGNSSPQRGTVPRTVPPAPASRPAFDAERYLAQLDASHEALRELELFPETCATFGIGYANRGVLRGRVAIRCDDPRGECVGFIGRSVKGESPLYLFPNGFDPRTAIFNAHRVTEGELRIMSEPLDVILAHQNGVEGAICFLTETVSAEQLTMLTALMDEREVALVF